VRWWSARPEGAAFYSWPAPILPSWWQRRGGGTAAGRGVAAAAGPACCAFPVLTREGDAPLVPWSRAGEPPWSRRTGVACRRGRRGDARWIVQEAHGSLQESQSKLSMRDGLFLLPTKTGGGCPDIAAAGGDNRNLTFYRSQHQHEQLEWLRLRPLDAGAVT